MDAIRINRKQAKMVAHRGLSGIELENTCAAFVAAGNRDYWGIETDVHQTADGKYIIFHDDNTGRVTTTDMVVEMSTGADVGKYTGFYYTFSMAAQITTPLLSGLLIDHLPMGYSVLFPYAVLFSALSFVTMLFVKHGDAKPAQKASLLEHLDTDD